MSRDVTLSRSFAYQCFWRRRHGGEARISISCQGTGTLELAYNIAGRYVGEVDIDGPTEERLVYAVRLTWTRCNYGGERPWFLCPVIGCGRRVGKLYLSNRYFVCRHCTGLAYACQSEDAFDRAFRRRDKIERKLGDRPGRPKGMHQATYERLRGDYVGAELELDELLAGWLATLKPRAHTRA